MKRIYYCVVTNGSKPEVAEIHYTRKEAIIGCNLLNDLAMEFGGLYYHIEEKESL